MSNNLLSVGTTDSTRTVFFRFAFCAKKSLDLSPKDDSCCLDDVIRWGQI